MREFLKKLSAPTRARYALRAAGLVEVAAEKVLVTGVHGPLEDGWRGKVEAFATQIPV